VVEDPLAEGQCRNKQEQTRAKTQEPLHVLSLWFVRNESGCASFGDTRLSLSYTKSAPKNSVNRVNDQILDFTGLSINSSTQKPLDPTSLARYGGAFTRHPRRPGFGGGGY